MSEKRQFSYSHTYLNKRKRKPNMQSRIENAEILENDDFKNLKLLLSCFPRYEQFDWIKKVISTCIISLYFHDIMSLTRDLE